MKTMSLTIGLLIVATLGAGSATAAPPWCIPPLPCPETPPCDQAGITVMCAHCQEGYTWNPDTEQCEKKVRYEIHNPGETVIWEGNATHDPNYCWAEPLCA
ncbi:MAG: hypothetical protein QOD77_87 [Thermoplasmata archaeon]|jgi:hypothetical protein|nr:hypothetical protein [Thermoplasmata archaeon]